MTRRLFALMLCAASVAAAAEDAYVPPRAYFDTARREIDAARSSVELYLYSFSARPNQPDSQPAQLADALIRAHRRGLRVAVTLNKAAAPGEEGTQNAHVAQLLTQAGVPVFFADGPLLHAKALVVDGRTVLMGSSNWSGAAFANNAEANVLLRSPQTAASLSRDLSRVPRRAAQPAAPDEFAVPTDFLMSALGALVRANDERAFDAYLSLRRSGASGSFPVAALPFARAIGLKGPTDNDDRRQVFKAFGRLQDRGLLTFQQNHGQDPVVTLPEIRGNGVGLPAGYSAHGWDRRLPFSAKVFLLLNQFYSPGSPQAPRWSVDQKSLAKRHGVSVSFLQQGVTALRRANLLAVEHAPLTQDGRAPRRPNIYTPLPLYNPGVLEARFQDLQAKHGLPALARAREVAALVYADADADTIERLIVLEEKTGPAAVDQALQVIGAKNPDNPKRSPAYLIGTIQSIDRQNREGGAPRSP